MHTELMMTCTRREMSAEYSRTEKYRKNLNTYSSTTVVLDNFVASSLELT